MALGTVSNTNSQWQRTFLSILIQRRKIALGLAPAADSAIDLAGSALSYELASPDKASRLRTNYLTPLMTQAVQGIEDRTYKKYGFKSAGMMVTKVMRAMKALSKYGFAKQLQTSSAAGASSTSSSSSSSPAGLTSSAAAVSKQHSGGSKALRPAGYVWETFVMYVFEQQCESGAEVVARYSTGSMRELHLFLDVLLAASHLLRTSTPASSSMAAPITLSLYYTAAECELFRGLWDVPECVCTPYIIHPADPSFNCTAHGFFRSWDALADFLGDLHQQLQAALCGAPEQALEAAAHLQSLMLDGI
jgi:hypothetical protein